MKKKYLLIIGIILCLSVGFVSKFLYEKSTILYAESADRQWSACVVKAYGDPKHTWDGMVFYRGENRAPAELWIGVTMDGQTYEPSAESPENPSNISETQRFLLGEESEVFYYFLSMSQEKPKEVTIELSWEQNGKIEKQKLLLK